MRIETIRQPSAPRVDSARATWPVATQFWLNGLAFASWMARIPALQDRLDANPGEIGALLLCLAAGAVLMLPLSGTIVQRAGSTRAGATGVAGVALGALTLAAGAATGSGALVAAGLFATGLGGSLWDVSMNVDGAAVERHLRRPLMPRFHAAFSLGTMTGALMGAGAAAAGVGVAAQLLCTTPLIAAAAALAVRRSGPVAEMPSRRAPRSLVAVWREPRTRLLGVLVFSFALAEGAANDWLALALTDGLGAPEWLGSLAFAVFAIAMTTGRLLGGTVLRRRSRVVTLRLTATFTIAGALIVITAPTPAAAIVGAACWGFGTALGFPVGMSAAADEPSQAAARVAVVSTIGYTAFLAGPPLVGQIADAVGIRAALVVVPIAAVLAVATAPASRPAADPDHAGLNVTAPEPTPARAVSP